MADAFVLFLLFVVCVGGFSRGILGQLWSLAALLLTTYVTGKLYLSFASVVGPLVKDEAGGRLLAFLFVFVVTNAILNGPVYAIIDRMRGPSTDSGEITPRLVAAALGALTGVVLIQVGAALLVTYPILGWDNWIRSSDVIKLYVGQWPVVIILLPPELRYSIQLLR